MFNKSKRSTPKNQGGIEVFKKENEEETLKSELTVWYMIFYWSFVGFMKADIYALVFSVLKNFPLVG